MQVFAGSEFEITQVFKKYHKYSNKGTACYKGGSKGVPAVHGREPVRIKAHQPEPGNSRHNRKGKQHDVKGGPNRIVPDIAFPFLNSRLAVVDFAGKGTHLFSQ